MSFSRIFLYGVIVLPQILNSVAGSPGTVTCRGADASSPTASLVPPQAPSKWDHTAQDIANELQAVEEFRKQTLDKIASLEPGACTFESVFLELAQLEARMDALVSLAFYSLVSPVQEVRDAADKVQAAAATQPVEGEPAIINAKINAENNIRASGQWEQLNPEEQLLITYLNQNDKLAGLGLPSEQQAEVKDVRTALTQAESEFVENVNKDKQTISLSKEDLKGVPANVLSQFTKQQNDGGQEFYDIPLGGQNIDPILTYSEDPETRQTVFEAAQLRIPANIPVLEKILDLRRQQASHLGYKTWADYRTVNNMIGNADNLKKFLDGLNSNLQPFGLKDRNTLLAIKKRDLEAQGVAFDGEIYLWDFAYYNRKFEEEKLSVNQTALMEYFPLSVVLPKILNVYEGLFGVRFEEMKDAPTWHSDVQTFAVWNKDATDESGFIGYCYFDLIAREDKVQRGGATNLLSGYEKPDGSRSYPTIANFNNFPQPTEDKPTLLTHLHITEIFQTLGLSFNHLLSRTKFSLFHGASATPFELKQVPMLMFENFAWERVVLEKVSSHYKTQEPLPSQMIDDLVKSRGALKGTEYMWSMYRTLFDLNIHTEQGNQDYTSLWNTLRRDTTHFRNPRDIPGQTLEVELVTQNHGRTYSILFGFVYAADLYDSLFKEDPLSAGRGLPFREKRLSVGSSGNDTQILLDLLGRLPNDKALVKRLDEWQTLYSS